MLVVDAAVRTNIVHTLGCLAIAAGLVLIALPLGVNEFSLMAYLAAAALLVAAAAPFTAFRRPTLILAYAVGALATFDLVRLLIGANLDLAVFLLIALALAAAAWHTSAPASGNVHGILLGTIGAATYLVHDIAVGYTGQLAADALLAAGFATLWHASRQTAAASPNVRPVPT